MATAGTTTFSLTPDIAKHLETPSSIVHRPSSIDRFGRFGTITVLLRDADKEASPAAVRLSQMNIHTVEDLRKTPVNVLFKAFPEAHTGDSQWRRLLQAFLQAKENADSPISLIDKWQLVAEDCVKTAGLPPCPVMARIRLRGITSVEHFASLNDDLIDSLFPCEWSEGRTSRLAAAAVRSSAQWLLGQAASALPPRVVEDEIRHNMWAIEALALGFPLNCWRIAQAILDAFSETKRIAELGNLPQWKDRQTWPERCHAVGLPWLSESTNLDQSLPERRHPLPGPRRLMEASAESRKRSREDEVHTLCKPLCQACYSLLLRPRRHAQVVEPQGLLPLLQLHGARPRHR